MVQLIEESQVIIGDKMFINHVIDKRKSNNDRW